MRVVATRGAARIVQTRHGLVLAAAGVDDSNSEPGTVVLLPEDPDASARALRAALADRLGVRLGVIITDTLGRPWRVGQTDTAIGLAGLAPVLDHRGHADPYGNPLEVTMPAVADEIAGAGDLVKGKLGKIPVAIVRGLAHLVTAARWAWRGGADPAIRRGHVPARVARRALRPPDGAGLHQRARRRGGGPPGVARGFRGARAAPFGAVAVRHRLVRAGARRPARRHARGVDHRPARRRLHRGPDHSAGPPGASHCAARRC